MPQVPPKYQLKIPTRSTCWMPLKFTPELGQILRLDGEDYEVYLIERLGPNRILHGRPQRPQGH